MGKIYQQKKVKPYPRNQAGEIQKVDSKEKKMKDREGMRKKQDQRKIGDRLGSVKSNLLRALIVVHLLREIALPQAKVLQNELMIVSCLIMIDK